MLSSTESLVSLLDYNVTEIKESEAINTAMNTLNMNKLKKCGSSVCGFNLEYRAGGSAYLYWAIILLGVIKIYGSLEL